MTELLEWLTELVTASRWSYGILFAVAALDAVLPVVPSETLVIAAGVLAAADRLALTGVLVAAAAGALVGDNASYLAGRKLGRPIARRAFRGRRARRRLEWAERQLDARGAYVILIARFIPGGRIAVTFTAGLVRLPWGTRFLPFSLFAAVVWASYAALLGYFGGRVFEAHPWRGLVLALVLAAAVAVAVEVWRRVGRGRRGTGEE